ncbi:MAG TPA: hypothetical protein VG649_07825 [Candidatus Angelobacter sp.]|jgi:hypothetical protein|nr:hypothetical protein [Candidatus Angelobacter sp.]
MKPVPTGNTPSTPSNGQDLCVCTETEPASSDFRTVAKHVTLPQIAANEISVGTILGWPVPAEPAFDATRQGRELQLFHIGQAFLQFAWLNIGDCDLHLEISDSQDKNAPRVIVETPFGDMFCSARRQLSQQLSARGFTLNSSSGELPTPVAVDVVGLAFQDFNHSRGTSHVATVWELHPAIVNVK